jgi:hypothetical protein
MFLNAYLQEVVLSQAGIRFVGSVLIALLSLLVATAFLSTSEGLTLAFLCLSLASLVFGIVIYIRCLRGFLKRWNAGRASVRRGTE